MARYAAQTTVPADRSRGEIERTLTRYGATAFMYGWEDERAVIAFMAHRRQVRFTLPMPDRNDRSITHTPGRQRRNSASIEQAYNQAIRQRWRALLLVVKAKLEAVETGIVSFDDEFLAHFVLPGGSTVGEQVVPHLDRAYATGDIGALLPGVQPAITAGELVD